MLDAGHIIGGTYEIVRLLGEGGMAQVYIVNHTRLPRQFALKLISPGGAAHRDRFRREAEILARLHHRNIVEVVDWNVTPEGLPYLVMELLEGQDLAAYLGQRGPMPMSEALGLLWQVGAALGKAHAMGVIHRDLKPSNIFLCGDGLVKVLDFGVAKLLYPGPGEVRTGTAQLLGTPAYMAPEQALGHSDQVDVRTDLFALAAILSEMLTGCQVFGRPGDPPFRILEQVIYYDPVRLAVPGIGEVVARALDKDRERRFPSVAAFLQALAMTGEGGGGLAGELWAGTARSAAERDGSGAAVTQSRRWGRRRTARWLTVPAVLLMGGMMGGMSRDHGPQPRAQAETRQAELRQRPQVPEVAAPPGSPQRAPPGAAGPGTAPGAPAPRAGDPPDTRAPAQRPRALIRVAGANPDQERQIRRCLPELQRVAQAPYRVTLERVTTLKVLATEPPELFTEMRRTEFRSCLQRAFNDKEDAPEHVTIYASYNREPTQNPQSKR